VLVLSMAALVGTAGLASLRGEDSCSDRFTREESSTVQASQALSLWPPGVACQLIPDDGRLVDEVDRSAWGFLALVTLEIGLIAGVVRSPTTIPLALRAASIATAGLPLGALAACGSARSPARRCRSSISSGPRPGSSSIAACAAWAATTGAGPTACSASSSLPRRPFRPLRLGALQDPLAHAMTVVLVAGGAELRKRLRTRSDSFSPPVSA
jgi:hypothetical protein